MKQKSWYKIGLAIFSLLIINLHSNALYAHHEPGHDVELSTHLLLLNDQVGNLYELSKDSNKSAVYQQLQQIKTVILQNNSEFHQEFEYFDYFENEISLLEKQLVKSDVSLHWKQTISRLFLASDAMVQGNEGPWSNYEVLLLNNIRLLETSFIDSESYRGVNVLANLSIIEEQLSRIELAVKIVGDRDRLEELQFRIVDLKTFMLSIPVDLEQMNHYAQVEQSIKGIKQTTLALFEHTTSVSFEPELIERHFPTLLAALLTTIIIIVLSYTGYRKYKQSPYGVKKI